jgi:hypothetical protein
MLRVCVGSSTSAAGTKRSSKVNAVHESQVDLFEWARELEAERKRVRAANERRSARRGFLVFATDPGIDPDDPGYRQVFATEARTPAQAIAKIRPLADGRRLRAYLATGHYSAELADARWVA